MAQKTCPICLKNFTTTAKNQTYCDKYCSRIARQNSWRKKDFKEIVECPQCGTSFKNNRNKQYCSIACRNKAYANYMKIYNKRKSKKNSKESTTDQIHKKPDALSGKSLTQVVKLAKEAGMSYGKYVMMMSTKDKE